MPAILPGLEAVVAVQTKGHRDRLDEGMDLLPPTPSRFEMIRDESHAG